jgi:2'-5' RNA ligase
LFFALWPERVLQFALAEATRDVVLASGGRSVPPENFHVTLAFLGSVPEARLSNVMAIGAAVAAEVGPMQITVGLETLEYWKKPQVLCVTCPESSAVHLSGGAALADTLKSKLSAAGFTPDLKPFRNHVTVARKVVHPTRSDSLHPVVWIFTEFALIESHTQIHGARYSVLKSYPLVSR